MASAPYALAPELAALVARTGLASTQSSEFVTLVSVGAPPSRFAYAEELVLLASCTKEITVTQTSELVVLVAYVEGGTQRFDQRSWGFSLDQHQFYVLHLGVEGTFVYDVLSGEWAEWNTQGFDTWNAEAGIEWNGEVYFGDNTLPTLWRMDPDSFLDDDFRPIKRVVTGGIPAEARETIRTGLLVLSATKQGALDDEGTPYVQLSISDDAGETWKDREALSMTDSLSQDLSWSGLGQIRAPGRVFKITDESAVVTIKGADLKIKDDKKKP